MTKPGIDIFGLYASYEHYLSKTDFDEGNSSRSIDSQAEVTMAAKRLYHSNNPRAQIDFYQEFLPKIEAQGWQIPAHYRKTLARQVSTHQNLRTRKDNDFVGLGTVPVSIPYRLNMDQLVKQYAPGWQLIKTDGGKLESLSDATGGMVLYIVREGNEGNFRYLFSPLSPDDLRYALLWMPSNLQEDFTSLLGLPAGKNVEKVKAHIRRRIEWEEKQPIPLPTNNGGSFDPLCQINRSGTTLKGPKSIREAIMSQCSAKLPEVSYPGFGVTTADSPFPVLETHHQYTCLVLLIHDQKINKSLLAHLPTSDKLDQDKYILDAKLDLACYFRASGEIDICCYQPDAIPVLGIGYDINRDLSGKSCPHEVFPLEWYASLFRHVYFKGSKDSDLVVTILEGAATASTATADAREALQRYFPKARIRKIYDSGPSTSSWIDSRTGDIYIGSSFYRGSDDRFQRAEKPQYFTIIQETKE